MSREVWEATRKIAARRDGYRCRYCKVPTAATIEHMVARSKSGGSSMDNLCLACPYCNSRKGDRPLEAFLEQQLFKLARPAMPETTREMLSNFFGWNEGTGWVSTGSTNAKLQIKGGKVSLMVRAGKTDAWHEFILGALDHPKVTLASWEFLARHFTPKKPKKKIPKSVWAKKTKASRI